jgi:hypothetical protein
VVKKSSARLPRSNSARGETDYDTLGAQWRSIGLSGPATEALVDAKLYKVSDLRKITLSELTKLEGLSKSAIARIKVIMEAKGIRFQNSQR